MRKEAKEKLVEKNIKWKEEYTDKTQFLKDQFEDVVGPGSYFRFEGRAPNGDGYYCIVGPAKVHAPRAKFFAGVRKLPATYSAGGKYFDSLDTAAKYAKETWGVPTPASLRPYTSGQLYNISSKVSDWKAKREKEEEKKDKKDKKKDIESFNIDFLSKEAMGGIAKHLRSDYTWVPYEMIVAKESDDFEMLAQSNPSFYGALNEIKSEKRKRYSVYERKYNFTEDQLRDIFKTYVGYSAEHGMYVFYVGPYMMDGKAMVRFYDALYEHTDFNGTRGADVPDEILRKIMNSPTITLPWKGAQKTSLQTLAKLFVSDRSGWFSTFQRSYPITSEFRADREFAKHNGRRKLDAFDDFEERTAGEQIESLEANGVPLVSPMGLGDYSYMFNYNNDYSRPGKSSSEAGWFRKTARGPNGKYFGTSFNRLPADDLSDPMCQIYSFKNYQDAEKQNMIQSSSGTRVFLNNAGIMKGYLNLIAMYPEYNEAILNKFRDSNTIIHKYFGKVVTPIITRNMPNFIYFLSGMGQMSEQDIQAISREAPGTTVNGVLDPMHTDGKKQGGLMFSRILTNISSIDPKTGLVGGGSIYSLAIERQRIAAAGDENELYRIEGIEKNITEITKGLRVGATKPMVAKSNQALSIGSDENNKHQLIAEIAEFMAENNISDTEIENCILVADFINAGGSDKLDDEGKLRYRSERGAGLRKKLKSFKPGMAKFYMQKILTSGMGKPIQETASDVVRKADDMSRLYRHERRNLTDKQRQKMENDARKEMAALADEEEEGGGDTINLMWDKEKQSFISHDIHRDFYEVFENIQSLMEIMSYEFDESFIRKRDGGTRAYLPVVNPDTGEVDFSHLSPLVRTPPPTRYTSKQLEDIYRGLPQEQQIKYRLHRGDQEMFETFTETFGNEAMEVISARDFQYQKVNGEITPEIIEDANRTTEEEPDEEDEEVADVNVNIPPEADQVEKNPWADNDDMFGDFDPLAPEPAVQVEDEGEDDDEGLNLQGANTINHLIALSQELDNEGKTAESIELLRLAKKFSDQLKKG